MYPSESAVAWRLLEPEDVAESRGTETSDAELWECGGKVFAPIPHTPSYLS